MSRGFSLLPVTRSSSQIQTALFRLRSRGTQYDSAISNSKRSNAQAQWNVVLILQDAGCLQNESGLQGVFRSVKNPKLRYLLS